MAVLLLVGLAGPASAAKRLTIAQFEQMLASQHGGSDTTMADRLTGLELTERVSTPRLLRWEAQFPGSHTRFALIGLADSVAFLNPPADELPAMPRPDMKTQEQMVTRTLSYLRSTVTKLPNFFASRDTVHFEDVPPLPATAFPPTLDPKGGMAQMKMAPASEPLHMVSRYSVIVRYRDGAEIQETKARSGSPDATSGLTTRGEFGPILAMVLSDALRSKTVWQRWENGSGGAVAVFHYTVPRENSHYTVVLPKDHKMVGMVPGYHGEIAIDPLTGNILRLSLITDLDPAYKLVDTALMVEYGPVTIGEQTYTCPLRSIAYSRMPESGDPNMWAAADFPILTRINDVAFTQYHLFRADSRIVDQAAIDPTDRVQPEEETATAEASTTAMPVAEATAATLSAGTTAPPAAPSTGAGTEASPGTAAAPVAVAAVTTPAPGMTTPSSANVLHAHARLVLVDVVVNDHGSAVHGLDREHVHIFEDGKEQKIASFEEHLPKPAALTPLPPLPPATFTNVPAFRPTGTLNILLIDGLNTPPQNLPDVQQQLLEYVGHGPQNNAVAVFALGSGVQMVQGFTTDTDRLVQAVKAAVAAAKHHVLNAPGVASATTVTRDQFDSMAGMASTPQARQALATEMGRVEAHDQDADTDERTQRVQATVIALQQLAHYLTAIPGRKNLVWVSGSFPVDLGPESVASAGVRFDPLRNNRSYGDLIRNVSAALAAARVAVYPVDARGLMTMPSDSVDTTPTRTIADMQSNVPTDSPDNAAFRANTQSEHISMQQIADETGGYAFIDTNDLKQAVARAIDSGSSYYTLGYVPPSSGNAVFRNIRVQLDDSRDKFFYRPGYYPAQPDKVAAGSPVVPAAFAAALTPGAPPSTEILLRARILPTSDSHVHYVPQASESTGALTAAIKGPLRRYIVDLMLDPATITLTSDASGAHHAEFDCALVAYDATPRRVQALDRRVRLDMTAAEYDRVLTSGLPFQVAIDLPERPITLRVAVYDPATGHTGSLEAQIANPDDKR